MVYTFSISRVLLLFMALYLSIQNCTNQELTTPDMLTNIAIDSATGNLYIGGRNFLLKTNADLVTIVKNTTGPQMDNPECFPLPDRCDKQRVPTPNLNKVLLLHKSSKQLVTCGSLYFGSCELRNIDTLEEIPSARRDIIASNQPSPAVGIIAQGPSSTDVFYIATTWSEKALKDFGPPAIATRTLEYMFGSAFELEVDKAKTSKLTFRDKKYEVFYVYGFASGGLNYFIAVQETYSSYMKRKKDSKALREYETKISHVCHKDESYKTYTEIPLKCTSKNGTDFNIARSASVSKPGVRLAKQLGISSSSDVLFVTFSTSKRGSKEPLEDSALCYYSVKEIEAAIKRNVEKCFEGGTPLGMPWVNDDKSEVKCSKETYRDACLLATSSSNYPIGGSISLSKEAVTEESNLISVSALPYEDFTAVFMGDTSGNLLKVSIGDGSPTKPYYKKSITGGKSIKKLVISQDKQSLYVGTSSKVMKVPIEDCTSHGTCQSCTGHGDPFCGWCSLYTKCSRRAFCLNSDVHPLRFTNNASQCIQVVSTKPKRVPYGSVTQLEATLQSLPPAPKGAMYKCYYGNQERPTTVFDNGTVICTTPDSGLPPISSDTGDIQVELSLLSTETGKRIVSIRIPFYDCTKMKGCVACAESEYDCDWCTYQGKCFADAIANCPNVGEAVLSKNKRPLNAVGCPYLEENQNLFLPNDISSNFEIKARNLPALKGNYGFKCILLVGASESPFHVDATRNSDSLLTCNPKVYSYKANTQFSSAKLRVLWRGVDEIQKPKSVTVTLYKCSVNRGDCSTCLTAKPILKCGWCKADISSCQVEQACPLLWKHRSRSCDTKPLIKKFWPTTGPPKGGTTIEIDGVDFGKEFIDIKNTVFIGNYSCIPDSKEYKVSKRIVCNTTSSGRDFKGPVRIIVNNFEGVSKTLFSYQTPKIMDFHPKKGPKSGGSFVNITGIKLNTGRMIHAWLGDTPCLVDRAKVTDTSIPCVTQMTSSRSRRAASNDSSSSLLGNVIVSFDGFRPPSPSVQFEFTADPIVLKIEPDRTFPSGGLVMQITGDNFDSVQIPKMFYTNAGDERIVSDQEICTVISNTKMTCPSPNVTDFNLVPGSVNASKVIVGFIMDSVQGLRNVSTLAIVNDPYLKPFDEVKDINTENPLVLEGSYLKLLTKDQVTVTIEGVHCNVTAVADKNVVCNIPAKSTVVGNLPDGVEIDEFTLTVKAAYLTFVLGKVKYTLMKPVKEFPLLYVAIGVAVGGFVFIAIIICLICLYRKKKRQQYKSNERYEMKIANMESKVAKECRKAFAELQTDMTDWTSDLSAARMPFWDFRTYALHVLFPGVQEHAVLNMKSNMTPNWENGLRKFAQLIYNREFLLIFVRTLEQQNNFNMKDRCNLASLIMVALQSKMEYATDILKQLLCELVRKSVAQSHPKLLLRRTESVAEKLLTNWLAFCMFNHLKDESGKPLFMLFMAIKYNIEKGPVDMLTGDARYSLSENKLLRHTVEYETLRVSVSQDDEPPIQVTLLDSDTITQAKNKILDTIHKHEPYSGRPKQETFQLSLVTSDGAEKVLVDDDASSVVEGLWRRLNTLGHYKVPNEALLKLSTHHTLFYGSTSSDLQVHSVPRTAFKPFSYTPLSRGSREDLVDEGGKVWHLVKQVDYTLVQEDTKMMPEIYLTRLLATKGTLQQFVDNLFDAIFTINRNKPAPAIKFMFDLLDNQAQELNLTDPEVLHTWKNNSLPLRFWINIVKNPNFIFDLNKGSTIDSCLSVIAQLFMDACSTSDDRLSEDSPSNKLLYAKDISSYKKRVERYYADIRALPPTPDAELKDFFADLSMQYGKMFNADVALRELFKYVSKYQYQLQDKLEESGYSKLASNLEHVTAEIDDN